MIKITELKIISLESFIQDKNVPQNEIHLVWLGQASSHPLNECPDLS
ncbi:hypothetical protein LCGC14_0944610 [marine sediment metagenome]|uniref:Uncharacterized protein n=1 Tax=marine sediment metagenome TaxID=412755 RepID=A0A0F9P560_9ZZZZ